jgi:23S rRNA (cytosine1962-C5)-methyltransferase
MRRPAKKGRAFDCVVLDPPTFSQSKEHGAFRVEKDWGRLVAAALPPGQTGGGSLGECRGLAAEKFLADGERAVRSAYRKILQSHYFPQPPDFQVSRAEPAYLKTVWLKIR